MNRPAATPPAGTADLREAIARAICVARGTNPDCQHEGPARDGKIDGRWDRTPTANCSSGRVPWHYGWRNHAHVADVILAGPLATLAAENEALRAENERERQVREEWVRQAHENAQAADRLAVQRDALNERANNLLLAFFVLAESGHGGAIHDVRAWAKAGFIGPIPCTAGAVFQQWAAENGIVVTDGFMRPALAQGGSDAA